MIAVRPTRNHGLVGANVLHRAIRNVSFEGWWYRWKTNGAMTIVTRTTIQAVACVTNARMSVLGMNAATITMKSLVERLVLSGATGNARCVRLCENAKRLSDG
jgi:hypothetical protein